MALVTGYNGCFKLLVLAKCLETKAPYAKDDIALFTIGASVPDKGLSIDETPILSREKEEQDNHSCNGNYYQTTTGATVVNTFDFDITIGDDFNGIINSVNGKEARDIFKAFATGGTFKAKIGAVEDTKWTCIGVNGQSAIGGVNVSGQDHELLFYRDGLLKDPVLKDANGNWLTQANGKVAPYFDRTLIAFEAVYNAGTGNIYGKRIPYALNTTSTFNEGTGADYNKHSLSFRRLCDVQEVEGFLDDKVSFAGDISETTNTVYGLNVTKINDGASAVVGDTAIVIAPSTGVITFTEDEGVVVEPKVAKGTVIKAGDKIVVVKSANADGTNAVAVKWGAGTASKDFELPIMKFSYADKGFSV